MRQRTSTLRRPAHGLAFLVGLLLLLMGISPPAQAQDRSLRRQLSQDTQVLRQAQNSPLRQQMAERYQIVRQARAVLAADPTPARQEALDRAEDAYRRFLMDNQEALRALGVKGLDGETDAGLGKRAPAPRRTASSVTVYSETFDSNAGSFSLFNDGSGGEWYFEDACPNSTLGGHSADGTLRWGTPGNCFNYSDAGSFDTASTPTIDVSACLSDLVLDFNYFLDYQETSAWDDAFVDVRPDGGAFVEVADNGDLVGGLVSGSGVWLSGSFDLGALLGFIPNDVAVDFTGTAFDGSFNEGEGFIIDDVELSCTSGTDLSLTKTCDVEDDGTGSYELVVTNDGPLDASSVQVQEYLPALITVTGTSGNGAFDGEFGLWDIGDVDVGTSATLTINFTFDPGVPGLYNNRAEISAASGIDPDSEPGDGVGDDYDECGFLVLPDRTVADFVPEQGAGGVTERGKRFAADLEVAKDVDTDSAASGDQVNYTITLTNNGPHSTTKVEVTDVLPGCLEFVDATADRGTYDADTGVWTVGAVKVDEELTLTITANVSADCSGEVVNEAFVSASNLPDPPTNDPEAPLEGPFEERQTLKNNRDTASFTVGSGRLLDGTVFALGNNYPNPFNPTTIVPFSLPEASPVSIKVYDMLGRIVAVLVDGPMSAGAHEVAFEASALPTGVYLIRMEAGSFTQIQRVTLMK